MAPMADRLGVVSVSDYYLLLSLSVFVCQCAHELLQRFFATISTNIVECSRSQILVNCQAGSMQFEGIYWIDRKTLSFLSL